MPSLDYSKVNDSLIESLKHLENESNCIITTENIRKVNGKYDRLHIKYPYAKIFIKHKPTTPPSIYFIDHNDFIADLTKIEILKHWNLTLDHTCLYEYLRELIDKQFLNYNETKLKKFSKIYVYEQYMKLKESYLNKKLHIYTSSNFDYVTIVIQIQIDESIIREFKADLLNDSVKVADFYFSIMFIHYKDKHKFNIDYEFSPVLRKSIDSKNYDDFGAKFKEYEDNSIDMFECVQNMTQFVIQTLKDSYIKRKLFMNEFLNVFKSSVIEYDAKSYENVWILLSHNDFQCVLNVKLRNKFPEVPPLITLYSVYHVSQNRLPYKQVVQEYTFNSKWNINEMIQKLRDDLVHFVERFKESSRREGRLNI